MKNRHLFYLVAFVLLLFTCKDENNLIESQVFSESPVVKETKAAKSITRISAVSGGTIATTKGKTLISRGVCYGIYKLPMIDQLHTSDGRERGDFTSSITGLNPKTLYHVRAYAQTSDEIVYGPELTFETLPNNTPASSGVPSPASGATGITASPNLSWTAADPDGDPLFYTVYFGTNSNPTTIISTDQSAKSISRSGLTGNTRYYWKVISKDTFGASATSPIWYFTTGMVNNPPLVPSNPSPASNLTSLQPTNVQLSWSCTDPDGDPMTYDVYFGTGSSPSIIVSANQTAQNYSPSGLTNNTIYYWKIVAKDSKGGTTTGPIWQFKTELLNNPPVEPSNPSPASNLTSLQPTNVQLSWSCSDPDGDALTYDVYFGTSSTPSVIVSANQTPKNYAPSGLTNNNIYYWKIVAKDSKGGTTTGPIWQFKTELPANNPPETPSNPSPTNGSTNQPISLVLSWSCNDLDGDALTYDVYFGTSSNPTVMVSTSQSSRNYTPPVLSTNITYYWKIVAKDNKGATKESSVWNFTTKPNDNKAPDAPTGPLPVNGSINRPLSLYLSWSCSDPDGDALTYDVYFGTNSTPTIKVSSNQTAKNYTPSGLTTNTIYYWKIVVKDSKNAFTEGSIWQFKTVSTYDFDFDGHFYKTVIIGSQVWTVENLQTTKYNDGTSLIKTAINTNWSNTTDGAYCAYDNVESNASIYGYLYNWYAVNSGKLGPAGWRVPTDADWTKLTDYLGGESGAGTKLKAKTGWQINTGTDDYGFSALPGGNRTHYGDFSNFGYKTTQFKWSFFLKSRYTGNE